MTVSGLQESVSMGESWRLSLPDASLGLAVAQLVERCPPLDPNSVYCNLLQCHHFAGTSVAAITGTGDLVGFISAYLPPGRPNTLFVWQVAVDPSRRKQGLARAMLLEILRRPHCLGVSFLETTVTEDNQASQLLFCRLAENLGGQMETHTLFDKQIHFDGQHETEMLIRIGPFIFNPDAGEQK